MLTIYVILTQVAQFTGGYGMPYIELPVNSRKPAEVSAYTVQFTSLDGQTLTPFQPLNDYLAQIDIETAPSIKRLVNRLGIAYFEENTNEVRMLRAEFEELLEDRGVVSAEYQLILRVVNPVEKYNLESNVAEQILTTFQFAPEIASCLSYTNCPDDDTPSSPFSTSSP